ncbi:MAG: HD domain-containing protein [Butyricicoccus sp.]|nr:HD domain-containing protein [Butyricicoccus sp.]
MALPKGAAVIIDRLEREGYTAWAVGGCVRDSLRGVVPNDWDIATSAKPGEILRLMGGLRALPTGLKHGTVTVRAEGENYEVTTYRVESEYSDGRHPDEVFFVDDIRDDLARRDFTINAMAWHPVRGLCDPFGGRQDIEKKLLRAVGDPRERFTEDALRILRGLRFASKTGYEIEENTAQAMRGCVPLLQNIAAERIREELLGLLAGRYVGRVLMAYADLITAVLPELAPMVGHDQFNAYHKFDIWEHTVRVVEAAPGDPILRFALLLHDCGKPATFTRDERGVGHFDGHPAVSAMIAEKITDRLRFSNADRARIDLYVRYHDYPLGREERIIRRRLARFGEENFRTLVLIKKCDATGQLTHPENIEMLDRIVRTADRILEQQACLSLRQLAVKGEDMMALGLRGRRIGSTLETLLSEVVDGTLENEREALLAYAKELIK